MAEAILSSIAEAILKKLGSRVLQEIGLWWGLNDELEKLENTVSTVQAVLLNAAEKSSINNEVKVWLGRLKQAFYEADDLLDDFSTEALRQKVMPGNKISKTMRTFFSLSSNQIAYGSKMAHRVRDIRKKLNEIADSRKFHLDERFPERSVVNIERDTHSSPPKKVVSREDDKRVIMDYLLSGDREDGVGVISIVGIGGLGKTTLAQSVFNDQNVKEYFEPKLWVCVSDNFELKVIVGKILGADKSKDEDMNKLKDRLLEEIKGKRYLLVLDDVWSDDLEKWSRLTDLLVGGSKGSRIIVTTRLKKVAKMTQPIVEHEMQGLSEMDSWKLFKQMAFKKGQACTDDHEKIGKEILKKCCGVPLAIRAIGRLLFFKERVADWRDFEDKEIMKIDQVESSILPVLEISYNHLPSHLKNCFVYCRLFPKDWEIDVPKLINYWIAQGFVKVSDATQCPMDVGLEYFMELSWRSFFQEVKEDKWGNVSSCKMHDLIHDLASNLAGVESVMFDDPVGDCNVDGRTIHASFLFNLDRLPASLLKAGNLRTLLLLDGCKCNMDVIISKFKRLRTLDLQFSNITDIPYSISKLKHLKHFDVTGCKMKVLPNVITMLHNLLTLILDGCYKLEQLPRDTKKLVNLAQLSLKNCGKLTHIPQGIGQLCNLKRLYISGLQSLEYIDESTTKSAIRGRGESTSTPFFPSLETLELVGCPNLKGWWRTTPTPTPRFPRLSQLEIASCPEMTSMPLFPTLKALRFFLGSVTFLKGMILNTGMAPAEECTSSSSAPSTFSLALSQLEITSMEDLESLPEDLAQNLHSLKTLSISACRRLKTLGPALQHLTSLEELHIEWCLDLDLFEEAMRMHWQALRSLRSLSITGISNLESFPSWFQRALPSLHALKISDCHNLKSVPALQNLNILRCPNLRYWLA